MEENQEKNIQTKVAIVTGASRGIGAEIVKTLSKNGYNVVLNYNKSKNLAENIAKDFSNVTIFNADVSKYEEVKRFNRFYN